MNVDHLVAMANQIGEFFDAMPAREEALDGIADHLRKFWAPRMRQQLTAHWESGPRDTYRPIVAEMLSTRSILPTATPVVTRDPVEAAAQHAFDGKTES